MYQTRQALCHRVAGSRNRRSLGEKPPNLKIGEKAPNVHLGGKAPRPRENPNMETIARTPLQLGNYIRQRRRELGQVQLSDVTVLELLIAPDISRGTLVPRSRVCACRDPTSDSLLTQHVTEKCRLTNATLMSDIEMEWTLNASLTTSSSYRKCSKRRILGHSAQAISLLPIEGTTKCSRTALGFGSGSVMGFAADLRIR